MIGTRIQKPEDRDAYFQASIWCNENNATIEDKGDYYEVVALPPIEPIPVEEVYSNRVVELIRERYSQDDEYAILRKKLAGLDDGEFSVYNVYCEDCKTIAKSELGIILTENHA